MKSLKVCLVFLTRDTGDLPLVPELERALANLDCEVEVIRFPYFWAPTTEQLGALKALLRKRKSSGRFLIFCPDSTELFLDEPDLTLAFSAYQSWRKPEKIRVIPHLWGPIEPPDDNGGLRWKEKPPLQIGFMGTLHETSRLAHIIRVSPDWTRKWVLSGSYLRFPQLRAFLNNHGLSTQHISTFPRFEVLNLLRRNEAVFPPGALDIIERTNFAGLQQHMDEYVAHLRKNTYVLCPRGTENYSYRAYESLCFGRVPVIIDTNMALPPEIDWDRLAVRIPYQQIGNISKLILDDYNRRDAAGFLSRQQEALETMARLRKMHWITELADECIRRARRKPP